MHDDCTHLTNDSDAATLCDRILSSNIRTLHEMDTGNGVLEVQEIFSSAIEILETEESAVFESSSFTEASLPFSDYIAHNTSFKVPWLLSDHVSSTPTNFSLMSRISSDIRLIKEKLQNNGLSPDTFEYNLALAKALADYIIDNNGFNIHRVISSSQEWTVVESLTRSHEADCSELSMIYYELCRLAGLNARIIQIVTDRYGNYRANHVCVALYLDRENHDTLTMVDLVEPTPFLPTPHQEWTAISKLDVMSLYRMNLGLKPPSTIVEEGAAAVFKFGLNELFTALSYSPCLPLLLYNIGRHYMNYVYMGNNFIDIAKSYFERALLLDPDDPFIRGELDLISGYTGE